jgi:predicted small secreted protein
LFLAVGAIGLVSACGSTWKGAKEDTKENVQEIGKAVEKTGEKMQK